LQNSAFLYITLFHLIADIQTMCFANPTHLMTRYEFPPSSIETVKINGPHRLQAADKCEK